MVLACTEPAKMQPLPCSSWWPELSMRIRSPSIAARVRRRSARRKSVRSLACSFSKRAFETIDSLSIRSRLIEDSTS